MNKSITFLLALVVSLLTGCASVVPMPTQEGSMPPQMKSVDYYKTHLNEVIRRAEDTNDPTTQFELGYVYGNHWYGVGDVQKSNYWIEKAASQRNLPALCALSARHYQDGWGYPKDFVRAEQLASLAYDTYLSKPKNEWGMYDTYMISGALLNKGVYAKTKEDSKKYICLAKNMNVKDENRIYMINKRIREKGITCD